MSGNCAEILAVGYIKLKDENATLLALIGELTDALERISIIRPELVNKALIARAREAAK